EHGIGRRAPPSPGGHPGRQHGRALLPRPAVCAEPQRPGYDVEIAATTGAGLATEERDGAIVTRRYRPTGRWARFAAGADRSSRRGLLGRLAHLLDTAIKVVAWPVHVRAWWAALRGELPPADLYHACGILTIPIALELGRAARRSGREGRVVYDVIDVILESNNYARVPRPVLAAYRAMERRWVGASDAVVTVNEPIATHLARTWRLAVVPTIVPNCQPRWTPPVPRPDLIRAATGIPSERRVVLFLGRLGRERGLEQAAEAVLALDDAALVLMGFGVWADRLREKDRDPRFLGRHFTLPPVHPDLVTTWTSSADASIIAVPANSLNQRLSSPNKFWESLTAGTPVVVGRDLEVMRRIVEADDLGAIGDPADPASLALALRSLLEAPIAAREARRARCLQVTAERYNWVTAIEPYLGLVERLVPSAGRQDPSAERA
ncbi:MAG TPA: glycosyltransferase, partial [Candidatus Deferrimicrobium sp.]|nr:glycosyltransferase [Candidatus Deferrimicrobium sp.]